jgi:dihydrofolate reductase
MRKVIFLMHVSLDGMAAGPNGEMDWIFYNKEVEQYSHSLHSATDAAIYGRVTYDMMQSYWPTVLDDPNSEPGALDHARWYADATKIVVSRTLAADPDNKLLVIRENIAEEITKLKQQPGKHIWLLGSPTVAQTMMQLDLIDEYRINVNPVILGTGVPLFGSIEDQIKLKLLEARTLADGVVALRYEPVNRQ